MLNQSKKVQFFYTCLVNEFYPEVGVSVVKVLERAGCEVNVPSDQTCCGQPVYNAGYWEEAKKVGKYTLDLLTNTEGYIILPSGSCTDMIINQYPILFQDDEETLQKSLKIAERCFEFTSFLVDVLKKTNLNARYRAKTAYHSSCHLSRNLGIKKQPLELLNQVEDLEITAFNEQEECCGFGGSFSVKNPEISGSILSKKIKNVQKSGAGCLTGCDMGCLMHIEGGLHRAKSTIKVRHIAQLLAEGLR